MMESKLIIDQFLQKYQRAVASRSSEMRMPIHEVGTLVAALSHVLNDSMEKDQKIIELQNKHLENTSSNTSDLGGSVQVDGGKF